ncbi:MAG: ATP-binding cassette domain-containing protein [Clostridiales bacterium]|nr:ATP-binding cassette domain-containing protein [Clostridiales bacterium]
MKLEVRNVSKTYGKVKALDNISVCFKQGIYGILGPNGAGKSTLINILTDNIVRDSGEVLFNDAEILKMGKEYRKLVGYMPQQQVCYNQLSAYDFLYYMAMLKGLSGRDVKERIDGLLMDLNLYEARHRKLGTYSGGMKRRAILAQALLGDPLILILDEPTAGLDPKERIAFRNIISKIALNKIVLLATHIVSDIECIADYVLSMNKGKVIKCQPPHELIEEIEEHVAGIPCTREELEYYQQIYKVSNVLHKKDGMIIHIVGNDLPETSVKVDANLDDVYLYYFECN